MQQTTVTAVPPDHVGDLDTLFGRLRPGLWRYLRVLGCDASTADDLAQEALLIAWRKPGFAAGDAGGVFTFLRTTARHLWLKHGRRRLAERDVTEADLVWVQQCGDGDGSCYVDALRVCVAKLPPKSRQLLEETYGAGSSRLISGARFGLSVDGVKSALRRLRTALHHCIQRRLGGASQ